MAIIIEPLGGLGNQIFVYALGLTLARKLGVQLEADLWRFHKYPWHVYELDTFQNSIDRTFSSRSREIFGHRVRGALRRGQTAGVLPRKLGRLATERDSMFDGRFLQLPDHSRLSGYFQSRHYFEPVLDELRESLSRPHLTSNWTEDTQKRLAQLGRWTAVHVRRGNYTNIPNMGLADSSYYQRAMQEIDLHEKGTTFVVFSDSPDMIPEMKVFDNKRTICIKSPSSVRAIENLRLMSLANHMIIGNSTFSWWAAYLRDSPNRVVIAPRPWLDDKSFNERDLLPPDWITLGRG